MTEKPIRTQDAVYEMSSDLGWRVIDDQIDFGANGRWTYHADVETDIGGVGRFQTRFDDDAIHFTSLWVGGFDITVTRDPFIQNAIGEGDQ